jgi:hypothetical protein
MNWYDWYMLLFALLGIACVAYGIVTTHRARRYALRIAAGCRRQLAEPAPQTMPNRIIARVAEDELERARR